MTRFEFRTRRSYDRSFPLLKHRFEKNEPGKLGSSLRGKRSGFGENDGHRFRTGQKRGGLMGSCQQKEGRKRNAQIDPLVGIDRGSRNRPSQSLDRRLRIGRSDLGFEHKPGLPTLVIDTRKHFIKCGEIFPAHPQDGYPTRCGSVMRTRVPRPTRFPPISMQPSCA